MKKITFLMKISRNANKIFYHAFPDTISPYKLTTLGLLLQGRMKVIQQNANANTKKKICDPEVMEPPHHEGFL